MEESKGFESYRRGALAITGATVLAAALNYCSTSESESKEAKAAVVGENSRLRGEVDEERKIHRKKLEKAGKSTAASPPEPPWKPAQLEMYSLNGKIVSASEIPLMIGECVRQAAPVYCEAGGNPDLECHSGAKRDHYSVEIDVDGAEVVLSVGDMKTSFAIDLNNPSSTQSNLEALCQDARDILSGQFFPQEEDLCKADETESMCDAEIENLKDDAARGEEMWALLDAAKQGLRKEGWDFDEAHTGAIQFYVELSEQELSTVFLIPFLDSQGNFGEAGQTGLAFFQHGQSVSADRFFVHEEDAIAYLENLKEEGGEGGEGE